MSRNKGRKRKNEDEYDLQTILDDEESNDTGSGIPAAAEKNAEKNDEAVRTFQNFMKCELEFTAYFYRFKTTSLELRIIGLISS